MVVNDNTVRVLPVTAGWKPFIRTRRQNTNQARQLAGVFAAMVFPGDFVTEWQEGAAAGSQPTTAAVVRSPPPGKVHGGSGGDPSMDLTDASPAY